MLLAFVIYFITFILPNLPEIQAQSARVRIGEIDAENASVCEKMNIKQGTDQHNQCLLHVGEFRWKVQKRAYDELDW